MRIFIVCLLLAGIFVLGGCGGGGGGSNSPSAEPPVVNPPAYSNASLNGTYVMSASGGSSAGSMVIAALFTANGQGQLTNGTLLTNTSGNVSEVKESTFTGTYNVEADGRGSASFTAGSELFTLRFVITASGVNVIRFNTDAVARGVILKQNLPSSASVNGRFVFNLDGSQPVNEMMNEQHNEQHTAGLLTFNGEEAWATRELVSVGTQVTQSHVDDEIGPFSLASNGIGTVTLTGSKSSLRLRVFVVSADRVVLIADESGKLLAGIAERQANSVALSGDYVFMMQGRDSGGLGPYNWMGIGRLSAASNGTITGNRDTSGLPTNDSNAPFSATYAMIADGRGVITIPDGPQITIYMISSDKGLMVGSGLNTFTWGTFQKQSGGPFSASTLNAKFGMAISGGPIYLSGIWRGNGTGTVSGTVDVYNNGVLSSGQTITGSYQLDSTGRGNTSVLANALGVGVNATFYVVSPNEVWMLAVQPEMIMGHAGKQ